MRIRLFDLASDRAADAYDDVSRDQKDAVRMGYRKIWKTDCTNEPSAEALQAYWRLCVDIARRAVAADKTVISDESTVPPKPE